MKKLLGCFLGLLVALAAVAWAQTNTYNIGDSLPEAIGQSHVAIAIGSVPGYTRVASLGHNPSIATAGTPADVWEGGGTYPFPVSAQSLEVVSSSANDTAAGTGARTVTIICLDASYVQMAAQVVTLNGTTPVAVPNACLRVNLFTTTTSGSGQSNAGDLTLRVAGGGTTLGLIRAGYGFSRQCVYTVPAGNTLFISSAVMTILSASGATVNNAVFGFWQRSSVGNARIPIEFQVTSSSPYLHSAPYGLVLTEKTDFALRVTSVAQNGTNVTGGFEGVLVSNTTVRK